MTDFTLAGYVARHERAPAFEGSDGRAYSVDFWVDDDPDARGRYGAAILFLRWGRGGDAPDGHLESEYVAFGATPDEARERAGALSLYDAKALLEELIAHGRPEEF